jgi:hypothetical protein
MRNSLQRALGFPVGLKADDQERSWTISEFCALEGISTTSYHKARKEGNGPAELRLPGMSLVRITPEARREWHDRMAKLQEAEDAQRERDRRSEASRRAGRKAALSSRHVSKVRSQRKAARTGGAQ